ncbi:hypothetical protein [Amycolatopsis sulphurea]|uniref:hypothetical protein n=1 Tax=Amycolatopsis sulphurea TaxID=76022 RepID=UPI0011460158|nr:hypothetical protein [Amycolatopsis sulphurea]
MIARSPRDERVGGTPGGPDPAEVLGLPAGGAHAEAALRRCLGAQGFLPLAGLFRREPYFGEPELVQCDVGPCAGAGADRDGLSEPAPRVVVLAEQRRRAGRNLRRRQKRNGSRRLSPVNLRVSGLASTACTSAWPGRSGADRTRSTRHDRAFPARIN